MIFDNRHQHISQHALDFLWRKLNHYDTRRLHRLRICDRSDVRGRNGFAGRCYYPVGLRHSYWIACHIFGNHYPILYRETKPNVCCTLHSTDEVCIYVAGHELFHFLSHSGQVAKIDSEPNAIRYGLEWLKEYRGQ